ncbi:unnamed protein product [Periconia digitata]|uniref:F-box domain-containing protein n=1 Tax=Periconia digitata TaxID=1303443 RepID=A0A9W4XN98_9PLEO|nr:unnamed protein product [Periconia digitata]
MDLVRCIQKWRFERQSAKDTRKNEEWSRQLVYVRNSEKQQTPNLILRTLQRNMDPLIAAQVYNIRYCPLTSWLPEEILLCVLGFLCDDPAALHCLRSVSRIFFRFLDPGSAFMRGVYSNVAQVDMGNVSKLERRVQLQLRQSLQRDGRCDACMRWNEAHQDYVLDDCKFRQWRHISQPESPHDIRRFFRVREKKHDIYGFLQIDESARLLECKRLGKQGTVQLCEHVQITWDSVKSYLKKFQRQRTGKNWQRWLDAFQIECRNKGHDARCTSSEIPTRPTARLRTCDKGSTVVLSLEWQPHHRMGLFSLTSTGKIPAQDFNAQLRKLRRSGPADLLCPQYPSGTLPEMVCFSQSALGNSFIYYKREGDELDVKRDPLSPFQPFPSSLSLSWLFSDENVRCRKVRLREQMPVYYAMRHDVGFDMKQQRLDPDSSYKSGKEITITSHYMSNAIGTYISQQCLKLSYRKDIMICRSADLLDPKKKIPPSDAWLHAMDPRTYPHPQATGIRPLCVSERCVNYNRRPKIFNDCALCPITQACPTMASTLEEVFEAYMRERTNVPAQM